jgi:[acyl-carrier-protein] S-malonyltransferase
LCVEISSEGRGIVAISSFLAPNTLLLLGEHATVDRFRERMRDALGPLVHLRKNSEHWPPLHTPILWHKAIPNRAAEAMFHLPGGFRRPDPPVLSLVTGKLSYNDYNSRDLLNRWIDHPQRLWDAVYAILEEGIETVVHVGPDPNLIPATFKRLSDNVTAQLRPATLNNLGLRAMSGIVRRPWVRRPWLAKLISSRAALLRAPLVEHVIAEDLLLRA